MSDCAHDAGFSTEFAGQGVGLVRRCNACEAIIATPPEPKVAAQESQKSKRSKPENPDATPKAQPKLDGRRAESRDLTPQDVVKLAKRRLREIKRELKALRKLEAEKSQLERLVNAADGRPVAVVRELKRSSG